MKKLFYFTVVAIAVLFIAGCDNKKKTVEDGLEAPVEEQVAVVDSAVYGVIGAGTSMHSLEVKDENGKTSVFPLNVDLEADLQGGLFSGDRITLVLGKNANGEKEVMKAVNLSSLCGKWTALDRNFEIKDDGTVESAQSMESNPYTQWSMINCRLVLNRDTFDVLYIGGDSLTIENLKGIFVYKRQK